MSIRNDLSRYYRAFGLRGALAMAGFRLIRRPKEVTARPPGVQNPLRIRIKTSDELAYKQVLCMGEYAFDLPFSPKTIVDAGANIGTTSIYFANRYPEAKIIAVEAEASNYELLLRNVEPYSRIIPLHAALWNRDGEIAVSEPGPAAGKWGFVTHEGQGADKVRAITMDTLMQEMGISAIDIAKVDIEGAELELFEDTRWLTGLGCLMIEFHDRFRPGCTRAIEPALQAFTRTQRSETTFYVREVRS